MKVSIIKICGIEYQLVSLETKKDTLYCKEIREEFEIYWSEQ